jgi:hypothetical protein
MRACLVWVAVRVAVWVDVPAPIARAELSTPVRKHEGIVSDVVVLGYEPDRQPVRVARAQAVRWMWARPGWRVWMDDTPTVESKA